MTDWTDFLPFSAPAPSPEPATEPVVGEAPPTLAVQWQDFQPLVPERRTNESLNAAWARPDFFNVIGSGMAADVTDTLATAHGASPVVPSPEEKQSLTSRLIETTLKSPLDTLDAVKGWAGNVKAGIGRAAKEYVPPLTARLEDIPSQWIQATLNAPGNVVIGAAKDWYEKLPEGHKLEGALGTVGAFVGASAAKLKLAKSIVLGAGLPFAANQMKQITGAAPDTALGDDLADLAVSIDAATSAAGFSQASGSTRAIMLRRTAEDALIPLASYMTRITDKVQNRVRVFVTNAKDAFTRAHDADGNPISVKDALHDPVIWKITEPKADVPLDQSRFTYLDTQMKEGAQNIWKGISNDQKTGILDKAEATGKKVTYGATKAGVIDDVLNGHDQTARAHAVDVRFDEDVLIARKVFTVDGKLQEKGFNQWYSLANEKRILDGGTSRLKDPQIAQYEKEAGIKPDELKGQVAEYKHGWNETKQENFNELQARVDGYEMGPVEMQKRNAALGHQSNYDRISDPPEKVSRAQIYQKFDAAGRAAQRQLVTDAIGPEGAALYRKLNGQWGVLQDLIDLNKKNNLGQVAGFGPHVPDSEFKTSMVRSATTQVIAPEIKDREIAYIRSASEMMDRTVRPALTALRIISRFGANKVKRLEKISKWQARGIGTNTPYTSIFGQLAANKEMQEIAGDEGSNPGQAPAIQNMLGPGMIPTEPPAAGQSTGFAEGLGKTVKSIFGAFSPSEAQASELSSGPPGSDAMLNTIRNRMQDNTGPMNSIFGHIPAQQPLGQPGADSATANIGQPVGAPQPIMQAPDPASKIFPRDTNAFFSLPEGEFAGVDQDTAAQLKIARNASPVVKREILGKLIKEERVPFEPISNPNLRGYTVVDNMLVDPLEQGVYGREVLKRESQGLLTKKQSMKIRKALNAGEPLVELTGEWQKPVLDEDQMTNSLKSIARVEARNDPDKGVWDTKAKSPAGAEGPMQIMPFMQRAYGVTNPYDPVQAMTAARKILGDELERFRDQRLAIAAYNAGAPAVLSAIKKAKSNDFERVREHLPKETRNYVDKVMGHYTTYQADNKLMAGNLGAPRQSYDF